MYFVTPKHPFPNFPDDVLSLGCARASHQSKLSQLKTFARLLTVLSRTVWVWGLPSVCWQLTWNSVLEGKQTNKQKNLRAASFLGCSTSATSPASLPKIPFCRGFHSVTPLGEGKGQHPMVHISHPFPLLLFLPRISLPRAGRDHPVGAAPPGTGMQCQELPSRNQGAPILCGVFWGELEEIKRFLRVKRWIITGEGEVWRHRGSTTHAWSSQGKERWKGHSQEMKVKVNNFTGFTFFSAFQHLEPWFRRSQLRWHHPLAHCSCTQSRDDDDDDKPHTRQVVSQVLSWTS